MTPLRLRDVCTKIGSGATPRGGKDVYLESGEVALIRSQNVYNDRFERNGLVFIGQEHSDQLSNVEVQGNDVLLNITGDSVARVCQVPADVLPARVNQHVAIIRPDSCRLDPRFLRFFFASPQMQAEMLALAAAGATRNALTKGMIESFEVPDLSVEVQRAIAALLGALEDKIELNRRMNEALEAMARAIFKDWFVDFGPTRAKAEGRAPYLAPELWDLFPDALDDEDKPFGWQVQGLSELVSLTKGRSYKSTELKDSDVALVTLKSFQRGGGYRRDGLKPYSGKYNPEQVVEPGELVVALTDVTQAADVIGKPAIVLEDDRYDALVASLDVGIVRLRGGRVGLSFISQLLRTEQFQNHAYSHCTGTTVLHLGKDFLPTFKACIPPAELAAWFENTVASISACVAANARGSRTLARTRDLLLPKLMSGEIRLTEAEKAVEAVA